jgi:hypothetical protein
MRAPGKTNAQISGDRALDTDPCDRPARKTCQSNTTVIMIIAARPVDALQWFCDPVDAVSFGVELRWPSESETGVESTAAFGTRHSQVPELDSRGGSARAPIARSAFARDQDRVGNWRGLQ